MIGWPDTVCDYGGNANWVLVGIWGLLGLFVLFLILAIIGAIIDAWRWHHAVAFKQDAKLLTSSHKASTLETHAVPTVGANGTVGVGVVTTGDSECYTTIWECGKYGRLVSDDQNVFEYAKPKSILWLKKLDNEVRIDGIEVEE